MKQRALSMNLQFFAEKDEPGNQGGNSEQQNNQTEQSGSFTFDYEKLASIVAGKQNVTEDTVLRNFFKNQGLSQEEATQAMQQFKQQKAASQPDVGALQTQVAQAQQQAQQALIERDAFLLSGELGVDLKTMPYLLKMADLSAVVGADGKVSQDGLKEALNKVLEELPQLKQQTQQTSGFKFGASGESGTDTSVDDQLNRIFGVKKQEVSTNGSITVCNTV